MATRTGLVVARGNNSGRHCLAWRTYARARDAKLLLSFALAELDDA